MDKAIAVVIFLTLALFLLPIPLMLLWNWLMPTIFSLVELTYWQAMGLLALSSILFKSK